MRTIGSRPNKVSSVSCSLSLLLALLFGALTLTPAAAAPNYVPSSFADLVEKYGPTVVNVYSTQTVKNRLNQLLPYDHRQLPDLFRHFFDLPQFEEGQPEMEQKRSSLGSGVIISKDGYILTNNHVIAEADKINIKLSNQEEYTAKVIGADAKTDLALIKIEPKHELPVVAFGDSDAMRVGDWVVAIGNPFGFEQTVTTGIVSGKGRSIGNGPYENFIQTDASINPGNSGGPLFNLDGQMVGINTAIFSQSGGNIGLGFAIPANIASNIMGQLRKDGKVTRGMLGVMIQPVTPDLAKQFGLEKPIGALVGTVEPGSPAAKAGIKVGDVIIRYGDKEITHLNMLPSYVAQTTVGSEVPITLIRDGQEKIIPVQIGKLVEKEETAAVEEAGSADRQEVTLGMAVVALTPALAQKMGLDEKTGILVTKVEPNSEAEEAGLRKGDVIVEANRQPMKDLPKFNQTLQQVKKGQSLLLLVKRDKQTRFVVIKNK